MIDRERLLNTFLEYVQIDSESGHEAAMAARLKAEGGEELYVVTCFSDRDKLLAHVEKEG